jgi:hypothetical protein
MSTPDDVGPSPARAGKPKRGRDEQGARGGHPRADISPRCVDYVYTINRANQRAFGTRKPKNETDSQCQQFLEQREFKLTLVDGFTVWQQLNSEASNRVMPFVWITIVLLWVFRDLPLLVAVLPAQKYMLGETAHH